MTRKPTTAPAKRRAKPAPSRQPDRKAPAKKTRRPMAEQPAIGALTPQDFEAACSEALGGRGWQKAFIQGTGIAQSTLTRYLRGIFPIPQWAAVVVEMLQMLRNNGLPVPDAFTVPAQSPGTRAQRRFIASLPD